LSWDAKKRYLKKMKIEEIIEAKKVEEKLNTEAFKRQYYTWD